MTLYRKKQLISSLSEGEVIEDIFVVKIKKGLSEYKKGYRFVLLLTDKTGRTLEYVYWGGRDEQQVKSIFDSIKSDSVIRVQGKISSYAGKLQLASNDSDLIQVLKDDEYEKEDFVPVTTKNIDIMYETALKAVEKVENTEIKTLLKKIYGNEEFKKAMKYHPGAISIHHNWVGGLLEHTLEVLEFCSLASKQFPDLDNDLLTAGALLHDIGKLEELKITSRIKGTTKGQLIGHLVIGTLYVSEVINTIQGFDESLKNKIIHMMLSHHGKLEYSSPKEPMFPEALAVYYADEISAKLSEMISFIESSKEETEDEFMFNRRHERNIYLR